LTSQEKRKTPPNDFSSIHKELAEYKKTITSEIENYRILMQEEIEKAITRLDEMEKNTIEKVNSEWNEYDKKLKEFRKSQKKECNSKLNEISHDSFFYELVESLAENAVKQICDQSRVESSID
jgi:F0F1-type ATP synthase membrane subunit b/b'